MRAVDRTLLEALPKKAPRFILTGFDPDGSVALEAAARHPESRLVWWHHDLFAAGLARFQGLDPARMLVASELGSGDGEPPDLVALPLPKGGEALLARELIEQAHDAVMIGGRFLAATDGNPAWLKKVVKEVFKSSDVSETASGAVVFATRKRDETVTKDHSHVVQLVHGRKFEFRTRPGVFSYGHIDQGSRVLLALADFTKVGRILDIGCGVGVLGIVAAASSPGSSAVLVDSNVRAVLLARENAARNEVGRVEVVASADPLTIDAGCRQEGGGAPAVPGAAPGAEDRIAGEGGAFDCVLANPPYFANFKIAVRFIGAAHHQLAKGGRLWLVAKAAEEHADRVRRIFGHAEVRMAHGYGVISATKR